MKKINYIIILVLSTLVFSSCLKSNLDTLPVFKDTTITSFRFEYRWYDKTDGSIGIEKVVDLKTTATIDTTAHTVICDITLPKANSKKGLPQSQWDQVSKNNLVGFCDISTGATIEPLESSPKLGTIGDFTAKNQKYRVTAADGKTSQDWSITVNKLTKTK